MGDPPKGEKVKNTESTVSSETSKSTHDEIQQLVRDIMTARLARTLELDDQETVTLIKRFNEFRAEQGALQKKRQEMLKSLKSALKSGASEEELTKMVTELQSLDVKLQELKHSAFEKIGNGMNATRRARLYIFSIEFESEMRKLIQKAREKNALRQKATAEDTPAAPSHSPEQPTTPFPKGTSSKP
jgi:predicted lactoylglutathione lyase